MGESILSGNLECSLYITHNDVRERLKLSLELGICTRIDSNYRNVIK